ncbi:FUSC family protein [Brachybacterium endophyticum]|uniref:FUSC family protein n=1 Tax=Brachybacterium endophyticum TaxID=2182385 RepID=A0A2U2RJN1_9MICO|nr:FUSC family protein [Brachybacterium endophyticum]PWH06073.1 FUSC family protein [Brachybacterium endophyticum]
MPPLLSRPLDVLIASDPGLSRLRQGLAGAVCVSAALLVEAVVGTALGLPAPSLVISMILGAVIAMIGSNALARPSALQSIRAAVFFPVALGVGLGIGTLVGDHLWVSRVVFVLVMFGAVYVRRFSLDFFFYGFLLWMGYFFSLFLHPVPAQLPHLMIAIVVGTIVVLALCTTVFRPHARRTLARIFRSMRARRNRLLRLMASRLRVETAREREKATRRIFDERTRFDENVVMSDGWAAHARALPVGWSAETLRRSLLDGQLALDLVGWSSRRLVDASPRVRGLAAHALVLTADGDHGRAARVGALLERLAVREQAETPEQDPRIRDAVRGLVRGLDALARRPADPHLPPDLEHNDEFTPAVALTGLGLLPGSPSVSRDVAARGRRWNPLARLSATTRQAVQVAIAGSLAIGAGTLISGSRYYWAVIAAFVVFTGTGTRMDSFGKSLNRVIGTALGLVAGIALAAVTAGHPEFALVVIVLSVFLGFYLIRVSYAYMMFFVTILVAQLYGILGQFSDALLLLRLAETAAGATIGMLVALLVVPVSTRDTVRSAEREVVDAIADLMTAVQGPDAGEAPGTDASGPLDAGAWRSEVDAHLLAVENAQRRLTLAAAPLTRYHLTEHRPRRVRRRLTVVATCVSYARTATAGVMGLEGPRDRILGACDEVAQLARAIAAGEHQLRERDDEGPERALRGSQASGEESSTGGAQREALAALAALDLALIELERTPRH